MAKHLTLFPFILIGVLALSASCSQKTIDFKCTFQSKSEYLQTTTSISEYEVLYLGDKDYLDKLLNADKSNPQISVDTSQIIVAIKTELQKNDQIPITLTYVETGKSDPNGILQNGDVFYGNYSESNSLMLDSVSTERFLPSQRDMFLSIIEEGYSMSLLDGKPMKVGDTLVTRTPMTIPVAGKTIEMSIVTTYKLKKIETTLAEFDLTQEIELDSDFDQIGFSASGSGNGTCIYSIPHKYIIQNSTTFILNMNMKIMDELSLEIKSTSLSEVSVEIRDLK